MEQQDDQQLVIFPDELPGGGYRGFSHRGVSRSFQEVTMHPTSCLLSRASRLYLNVNPVNPCFASLNT